MIRDREKIKVRSTGNAKTYLKYVLEWIGRLLPSVYEMLMPLSHDEIEVLILFPRYDTVVVDPFLVVSHRAPPVPVKGLQQR